MEEKKNLIIVESPAKAKTIEKILGKNYKVKSSFGHIRDLSKKKLGIDLEHGFKPQYVIPDEKKKVVSELRKAVKNAGHVLLASDEDREGEAIAWHLSEVLSLPDETTKRIVFHEITPTAIKQAITSPRTINLDLVNAQQARRILDRLVGFEISPILWKKVKPALSAGRVQSVAVRLIVEREREIHNFKLQSYYRISGEFYLTLNQKTYLLKADIPEKFPSRKAALEFLEFCKGKTFSVLNITKKPLKRTPPAPFTTSTLQQEASRRLKYSVSYTMSLAQRLYEAGYITYMRTDSVNLSSLALNASRKKIVELFGEKYAKTRHFKTRTKGAQEAHEAIRPTYPDRETIPGSKAEQRLYDLIWKRTIASQMEDARIEKTTVTIGTEGSDKYFIATGEVIKFEGFLKVYSDRNGAEKAEETFLPPLKTGIPLKYKTIMASEKFTQPPPRYNEAMLVRKLEELGIGRPSTYAPTITTIQQRGYVIKEDRPGESRNITLLTLNDKQDQITEKTNKETVGKEKAKLFPSDIGMLVNDFLLEHFTDILDYNFTATVEKQFDEIARGGVNWQQMIEKFYKDFHPRVEAAEKITHKRTGEKVLGKDPKTGEEVIVKIGRYGPVVQIGRAEGDKKPRYASLRKGQLIETITLEEALDLFKLPRTIGIFENKEMVAGIGRYGPYIRHDNKFYSIPAQTDDPLTITEERAIEIILAKREAEKKKLIKTFDEDPDLQILNGRWGPYIKYKKNNFRIPKKQDPENLTYEECMNLISEAQKKKNK